MNKVQAQKTPAPGHSKLVKRIVAILSLALLLFWIISMFIGMASAHAQLAAHSLSEGPMRRHPPTPSPTLSVVPSSTASATPAPAPSPTLTTVPLTKATIPANTTTLSSMTGQAVANVERTPGATPSTGSTVSPAVPNGEGDSVLPLAIGIGIAAGLLLLAVGLVLRIGLLSARKRKLPPSGAALWQCVRPTDQDGDLSSSCSDVADALPHTPGKSFPSRMEGLLITKPPVPKRRSIVLTPHFSRPTRLKALYPTDSPPVAEDRSSTLPGQNGRSIVTIRERAREREKKLNNREVAQFT